MGSEVLQIIKTRISTTSFNTVLRTAGNPQGTPLILLHGNFATSLFFSDLMTRLPPSIYRLAYDIRGYGDSEGQPIDATKGLHDYSEDLLAVMDLLEIKKAHVLGWSLGGGIVQTFLIHHSDRVLSAILEAPAPPFGHGGIKGVDGEPCFGDFAGSGGGMAHPKLVQSIREKDLSLENPFNLRNMCNRVVWNPPYRLPPHLEEPYFADMLKTNISPGFYPGDSVPSPNWPGFSPGTIGVMNALSPKYMNCAAFLEAETKPPILWIRGEDDQRISDQAVTCPGTLGQAGVIPNWPGMDVFPPQPMIAQTRYLLDRYQQQGGRYNEVVLKQCGHSPHLEQADQFFDTLISHINQVPQ